MAKTQSQTPPPADPPAPPAPPPADPPATMVDVRALVDSPLQGLRCGLLASVPAAELDGLKAASLVDDHPDAVAYARSLEAPEA